MALSGKCLIVFAVAASLIMIVVVGAVLGIYVVLMSTAKGKAMLMVYILIL